MQRKRQFDENKKTQSLVRVSTFLLQRFLFGLLDVHIYIHTCYCYRWYATMQTVLRCRGRTCTRAHTGLERLQRTHAEGRRELGTVEVRAIVLGESLVTLGSLRWFGRYGNTAPCLPRIPASPRSHQCAPSPPERKKEQGRAKDCGRKSERETKTRTIYSERQDTHTLAQRY